MYAKNTIIWVIYLAKDAFFCFMIETIFFCTD